MDGKSMIPPQGNTILYYSSQQPSLPWTLEGLFELTWCPLRALASCVASGTAENQGGAQPPPLPSHALNQNKPTQNSYINATFLLSHQDASTRMYLKLSGRPQSCVNVEKLKMLLHITFEFKRICFGEILAKLSKLWCMSNLYSKGFCLAILIGFSRQHQQ